MARIIIPLVCVLYIFQAMAAPVSRDVSSNLTCARLIAQIGNNGVEVSKSLASINVFNDVFNPLPVTTAQAALFNASKIAGPFALGFDAPGVEIVPANASALLLSAVQTAQTALQFNGRQFTVQKNVTQLLAQANTTLLDTLAMAQQAVDVNCTAVSAPTPPGCFFDETGVLQCGAAAPTATGANFGSG
ncbi:hypothetical protein C8F04DRAFT_100513 [Mycena alexandri]|uniref:Uncharacterized protein n=1 Tax=Mycena alexandri TaxID=1745969 RepID=A0AAD6WVN5_9AGAR|nr:hypothetical protein C8F04DRAFT_100513 [Mycena alexandri]